VRQAKRLGCPAEPEHAVYFGLRDKIVARRASDFWLRWRQRLFAFMYRNSVGAARLFSIPEDQYLEVGRQLEL
jgi:K+ transporter